MRNKNQSLTLLANSGFSPRVIVDIGVQYGTEGLYDVWPSAHIVLVEALLRYEPAMEKLAKRLPSAEFRIAAAGSEPGTLTLAMNPDDHGIGPVDQRPENWDRFEVPVVTVDGLLSEQGNPVALVKIDVDGPEIDVLNGSKKSLARQTDAYLIEAALLDQENARFGQIIEFMRSHNYEVFDIIEPLLRPRDNVLWQVDLLFIPRNSRARSIRSY